MAVRVKSRWRGRQFKKKVEKGIERNMDMAATFLAKQMTFAVSGPSPSRPNMPPGVKTGTLRRSLTWERAGKTRRRIGSTLAPEFGQSASYALYLEFGTKNMAKRPYQRPTLKKSRRKLRKIITKRVTR